MSLQKRTHSQQVNRLYGGDDTVGYSEAVTLVDQNGLPVSLGGGGGSSDTQEATQLVVAARLLSILQELQSGVLDINLPAGAATSALQNSILTALAGTLNVSIANAAVEITNDAGNAIPVSAAALPLPAGAATQTTLAAVLAALVGTLSVQVVNSALEITNDAGNPVPVNAPRTTATSTEVVVTANGTVAADAIYVSFYVTAGTLTIAGTTYPTGARVKYNPIFGKTYPAIAYTVSGGSSVSIHEVR